MPQSDETLDENFDWPGEHIETHSLREGLSVPHGLATSGLVLIAAFCAVVLIDNLPIALWRPIWVLNFAISLVDNTVYALVGLCLVAIAAWVAGENITISTLFRRLSRLSVLVSLAFLLLIPGFLLLTRQTEKVVFNATASRVDQARSRLDSFRARVASARTTAEIALLLKAEQGVTLTNDDRNRPVESLRQALLIRLDRARSQFPDTGVARLQWRWSAVQRSLRICMMSLGYAIAFGSLAKRRRSHDSFAIEIVTACLHRCYQIKDLFRQRSLNRQAAQSLRQDIRQARALDQRRNLRQLQDEADRVMAQDFENEELDRPPQPSEPSGKNRDPEPPLDELRQR